MGTSITGRGLDVLSHRGNYSDKAMETLIGLSVEDSLQILQDNETNESTFGFTVKDDLFPDYPLELTQLTAIVCVVFFLLGIPGNLITIIALARCKKVRFITYA